jgi:methylated-DNA-[protein]-cysteine S-methyltransferase
MSVPMDIDRTVRERAAAEGILDVAYDLTDSPVGELLVAATELGVCRICFDPEPERAIEELA